MSGTVHEPGQCSTYNSQNSSDNNKNSTTCCCLVAKSCLTLCDPVDWGTRLPCPLLSPGICSNSCPLSQWCYLTISSSATLFTCQRPPRSSMIYQSLLKFMSTESVMLSNHLILCCPVLLLPSVFPSIRVFSRSWLFASGGQSIGASVWASVLQMNIQGWFPLGLTGLISLKSKIFSRVFSSTTAWKHQFFHTQPSLWSNSHIPTWLLEKP